MLTVETIRRIRREHFLKGKTIKEIARDLKVSRNTVRKVLRSGETSFEYERDVQPAHGFFSFLLRGDNARPKQQFPTSSRLLQRGGGPLLGSVTARTFRRSA